MDFSFIHAADLHLGSPFAGLASKDPVLASRLASASREAMEELVLNAIEHQVQFVIIAGDLYDQDWKDTSIVSSCMGGALRNGRRPKTWHRRIP